MYENNNKNWGLEIHFLHLFFYLFFVWNVINLKSFTSACANRSGNENISYSYKFSCKIGNRFFFTIFFYSPCWRCIIYRYMKTRFRFFLFFFFFFFVHNITGGILCQFIYIYIYIPIHTYTYIHQSLNFPLRELTHKTLLCAKYCGFFIVFQLCKVLYFYPIPLYSFAPNCY